MVKFRALWLLTLAGIILLVPPARAFSTNLVFDSTLKEFIAKQGDRTAEFDFAVTNTGPERVTVNSVRASCGCTTPKLPALPWRLEPGAAGTFHVTTDLAGKFGTFQKSVFMDTTEGPKLVYVKITMPAAVAGAAGLTGNVDARTRNMQIAQADPQAIFRGECASCHSKPAIGKKGEELFSAACAVCHESDQRAVLVPDLHALKQTPNEAYWDAWVRNGKVGTMMPAFAQDKQGPLSNEQIESLVTYLVKDFPARKAQGHGISTASAPASASARAAAQIELPGNLPIIPPAAPAQESVPSRIPPTPNK